MGSDNHQAARYFLYSSVVWLVLGVSLGLILAIKFFAPGFLGGTEELTFGRIRPLHVNTVMFGFLSMGMVGSILYMVPRLCGNSLYSHRLAMATLGLWNLAILGGGLGLSQGMTQGREYAEYIWGIDVILALALIALGSNVFLTIKNRQEKKLYVSLWYFAATMLWFFFVYLIGNVMWNPPEGALQGPNDAIWNWFYGHNVLGLWFTTLGIGMWYYLIPIMIKRPLYSHLLSLISFWTIGFFYTGVGAHHLLQAPVPEWLKTIAVITSVLMMIPVLTFFTNITLTLRGNWGKLSDSLALRFTAIGFFFYVLTSVQGSFQALRSINMYIHFGQWPVAHAHLALLGSFGFLVWGACYYILPRVSGREFFSPRLVSAHFWLSSLGFIFFLLSLTAAGLVQGSNWWADLPVYQTVLELRPYLVVRAVAGGAIVVGQLVFAYNFIKTIRGVRE